MDEIIIIFIIIPRAVLICFEMINFFIFVKTDCESLIRKMLVLEPKKRYTIEQIKHHRWMIVEVLDSPVIRTPSTNVGGTAGSEPNEVVLRIMANIGIDMQKTKKSLKVSDA